MTDRQKLIAGSDEVGRGCIGGEVLSASVILPEGHTIIGLTDSKKLTEKKREMLYGQIVDQAIAWSIGRADAEEVDRINILQASLMSMKRAIENLSVTPDHVLVDGNQLPDISLSCEAIIKGDLTEECISAASIVAKVTRDREMVLLDEKYPGYGFAKHKGYGTKAHLEALEKLGPCEIHRMTFAPVRKILERRKKER